MKIIHFYPNFDNIGGAQSMVLSIFKGMKAQSKDVKICGFTAYEKLHLRYQSEIIEEDYFQLNFFKFAFFKDKVLISHHRKITTYFMLLSKVVLKNYQLIHIAHNEFYDLKRVSLFPKSIIAVSNRVKKNLIEEFNIKSNNIKVIYNGIEDGSTKLTNNKKEITLPIKLLYPARINKVKKQLELVNQIKQANIKDICITFCGDGEQLKKLKELTKEDSRFVVKGLVNDMKAEFKNTHFTMLFTEKEGLPVSLIESCMYSIPIICNDVGGNLEIVEDKKNGVIANTYSELLSLFNDLKNLDQKKYQDYCINSKVKFYDNFTQVKMVSQYIEYINETAN